MHSKPLNYAALNISAATTELVKGILVLGKRCTRHVIGFMSSSKDSAHSISVPSGLF